jgi:hypothetical protein
MYNCGGIKMTLYEKWLDDIEILAKYGLKITKRTSDTKNKTNSKRQQEKNKKVIKTSKSTPK